MQSMQRKGTFVVAQVIHLPYAKTVTRRPPQYQKSVAHVDLR